MTRDQAPVAAGGGDEHDGYLVFDGLARGEKSTSHLVLDRSIWPSFGSVNC